MLRETANGVAFRHELARIAFDESLSPSRRLGLHRKALAALTRPATRPPRLERLALTPTRPEMEPPSSAMPPPPPNAQPPWAPTVSAAASTGRALKYADLLPPDELAELLKRRWYECYLTDQADEALDALGVHHLLP